MIGAILIAVAIQQPLPPIGAWGGGANAEKALLKFARCAVAWQRDESRRLLTTRPGSPEEFSVIQPLLDRALSDGDCASKAKFQLPSLSFRAKLPAIRGMIAEQLYLSTFRKPPPQRAVPVMWAGDAAFETPHTVPYYIGSCVATKDPTNADLMLRTQRRSKREAEIGTALAPNLKACGRRLKFEFTGTMFRGVLAEALLKHREILAGVPEKAS